MSSESKHPSLLDEISEIAAGTRHGSVCGVTELLESLPPAEAAEFQAAINSSHKGTHVAKAMKKRGHYISSGSINRHRRRGCTCDQGE